MKKIAIAFALVAVNVCFVGCDDSMIDTPSTVKIDKHATVDMHVHQNTNGLFTIVTYTDTVYDNNAKIAKVSSFNDTLPKLANVSDTLDITPPDMEDEKDTVITHPKTYQFFISIK
jgi:hypothetical protein